MSTESNQAPWWAVNRDRFILWTAATLFGVVLWSIPKELSALREEHKSLLTVAQIQCVHASKDSHERTECLTLRLSEKDEKREKL